MGERKIRISYIKKPFAKKSFICLSIGIVALILALISLNISIRMEGNGGLSVGAWGLSSLLFAVTGIAYGGLSFLEKERNYLLSKIGIALGGLLVLYWICMIIVGFGS